MRRRTFIVTLTVIAATLGLTIASPQPTYAADKNAARLDELKANFKKRFPQIAAAKSAGQIGETMQGLIEVVDPAAGVPADVTELVSVENADRKELYRIIAEQEGTDADIVAKRNALRNYENAKPGDFLKKPDGSWAKKKA